MTLRLHRPILFGAVVACVPMAMATPPLWGRLKPGPFAVGFESSWTLDPSRTFRYRFSDGTSYGHNLPARPILVEVWYPAKPQVTAAPMREGSYLDFVPVGPPNLARFARDLRETNVDVISDDVLGKPRKSLTSAGASTLRRFLDTPTAAVRHAPWAKGRFPAVVYIQGYGSSLQDNSALCEYLASNGYVVLGSAYQDEAGHMIADRDTVCSDVRVLVQGARKMAHVDATRIGLVGHSGGAQSSLVYAGEPGSIVDAVVSLDTTQDYYFNDKSSFLSYVQRVQPENLKAPMLVAASQSAIFELTDSFAQSDRTYLTVDELGHEEFTSEGLAAAIFQHKPTTRAVRLRYTGLCEFVRRFLDSRLKRDSSVRLDKAPEGFSVEHLPAGTTKPPPYLATDRPPTPRQLRVLLETDPTRTLEVIRRWAKTRPSAPIYDGQLVFAIVDHLLEKEDPDRAKAFLNAYNEGRAKPLLSARLFVAWGHIYASNKAKAEARRYYEKALLLDPENKEAKQGLDKLGN